MEFSSLDELKKRLMLALTTRVDEIKKSSGFLVEEDAIWNYLSKYKWKNANGLTLFDMVNDILKFDVSNLRGDEYER